MALERLGVIRDCCGDAMRAIKEYQDLNRESSSQV
jgi:hypothetical protein